MLSRACVCLLAGSLAIASGSSASVAPVRAAEAPPGETPRTLDLSRALRLLDESSPELAAARLRADAAGRRTRDAMRRPNPTAGLSVENLGGSPGSGRAETSILFEQPLELGGDRAARAGMARSLARLAESEVALLRHERVASTTDRFLEAWELQERVRRLRVAEQIADDAVVAAEARLRAGAAPAYERLRARGFRALQRVERERTESDLTVARRHLALQWGADSLAYDALTLESVERTALPGLDSVLARMSEHPARRRAEAEVDAGTWRMREARAARVPDLSLAAGIRRLNEAGGTGLLLGVSAPLPLWGNPRGAEGAARAERSAAEALARGTGLRLRQEARAAHDRHVAAVAAWRGLSAEVVPAASEAMELIAAGYRAGRLSYVDIQDGQRGLLEADLRLIEATAEVWRTRMSLELLSGTALGSGAPGEGE